MASALTKGIDLLDEREGTGPEAAKGCTVTYNARLYLRRGDEVTRDAAVLEQAGGQLAARRVEGVELIDHRAVLGKRRPIAGVEKTLFGMRAGGYREVLVSAHLGYGEAGVPDLIPAQAMLRIRLWVREVVCPKDRAG